MSEVDLPAGRPREGGRWQPGPGDHDPGGLLDSVVIGAGQAGLAAGYWLARAGLTFVVLEAGDQPGHSWTRHYDSLRLFSPARYSSLPGFAFPAHPDHYPHRDEVAAYLGAYAERFALPVVPGAAVTSVERDRAGFVVATASGDFYRARTVVAATGYFGEPNMPVLPGAERFGGEILHSSAYHSPAPYAGKRVVVVGAGNSAVQIAVELSAVARTTLATRRAVAFIPQTLAGRDVHFWGRVVGLDTAPVGRFIDIPATAPVIDVDGYRRALAAGRPDRRAMFTAFNPTGVEWPDGDAEDVDAVIFATGYRPAIGYLAGIGALDGDGRPRQRAGISRTVPGLYFVGLWGQRSIASAHLRGVGADARYVVRRLLRFLRRTPSTIAGTDSPSAAV